MVAILEDYFNGPLSKLRVLDVGASTGIIDRYLSHHFGSVTGIDIDVTAINIAYERCRKDNLYFHYGDAMNLAVSSQTFDIVICSQVYEHVPDAKRMIEEIYRVLRPGGICYFAASNRLMWNETHYNLPLLSVIPRRIAHWYVRAAGKADFYHELHFSYWGLKNLVRIFELVDYTRKAVENPDQFGTAYMLPPGKLKTRLALLVVRSLYWAMPGYIWLLKKPGEFTFQQCAAGDAWGL